ncbi:hypothetical protein MMC25_007110 [Agyrium rufum]|nr:hypothetical protein [Agyrium rufum]
MDSPHAQHDPESRYRLIIRQQPIAARACGYGERDRRVIDPPPIVQLQLTDFDCNDPSDMEQLTFPWNIIHCTLWTAGDANTPPVEVTNVLDPNGSYKEHKRLMGTMIANAFLGLDPNVPMSEPADARRAAFYIFGDLSCRQNGTYRLKFSCASVNPIAVHNLESTTHTFQATAMSDIFEVFSAKDFPGMRASTPLTRELKRQGAPIQVKKGNEGKTEKKSQTKIDNDSDSADSSGEERTGGESSSYAGRKRKKRS